MESNNIKKNTQLGMPFGTACNRLKKSILFSLLKKAKENVCFQCGSEIENESELSVEHKVPYLDSEEPLKLFLDLENIAFSHLKCNVGVARHKVGIKHPSQESYRRGCRCEKCKEIQKLRIRKQRQ